MLLQAAALPIVDNFLTHNNLVSYAHHDPPQASRAQWPQGELRPIGENSAFLRDETGTRYSVFYRAGHRPAHRAPLLPSDQVLQLQAEFLRRQEPSREES
jgi:hypothetical protein